MQKCCSDSSAVISTFAEGDEIILLQVSGYRRQGRVMEGRCCGGRVGGLSVGIGLAYSWLGWIGIVLIGVWLGGVGLGLIGFSLAWLWRGESSLAAVRSRECCAG